MTTPIPLYSVLLIFIVLFASGFACGWHASFSSIVTAFGKAPTKTADRLWKEWLKRE